jgi:hypothetical protein
MKLAQNNGNGTEPEHEATPATSSKKMNSTEWADRITAAWRKSVQHIIETGRLLRQAKEELNHGQWLMMFSTRRRDSPIPFNVRMAQQLMAIASNPILSNANHESHLPPSWTLLYLLSSLPDDELTRLIDEERIHPGMTRADVGRIDGPDAA